MGVPSSFNVDVDVNSLPDISISHIPSITVGSVGPVGPVSLTGIPTDYSLDLQLTEIPSVRGHVPADFRIGVSVFGIELLSVRICGEAQVITEKYQPNPCEQCGRDHLGHSRVQAEDPFLSIRPA